MHFKMLEEPRCKTSEINTACMIIPIRVRGSRWVTSAWRVVHNMSEYSRVQKFGLFISCGSVLEQTLIRTRWRLTQLTSSLEYFIKTLQLLPFQNLKQSEYKDLYPRDDCSLGLGTVSHSLDKKTFCYQQFCGYSITVKVLKLQCPAVERQYLAKKCCLRARGFLSVISLGEDAKRTTEISCCEFNSISKMAWYWYSLYPWMYHYHVARHTKQCIYRSHHRFQLYQFLSDDDGSPHLRNSNSGVPFLTKLL